MFVLRPQSGGRVIRLLRCGSFSCPIYLSVGNSFSGVGGVPSGLTFRAFLLSGEGGIVTVKGPVRGPGIEALCLGLVLSSDVYRDQSLVRAGVDLPRAVSVKIFS